MRNINLWSSIYTLVVTVSQACEWETGHPGQSVIQHDISSKVACTIRCAKLYDCIGTYWKSSTNACACVNYPPREQTASSSVQYLLTCGVRQRQTTIYTGVLSEALYVNDLRAFDQGLNIEVYAVEELGVLTYSKRFFVLKDEVELNDYRTLHLDESTKRHLAMHQKKDPTVTEIATAFHLKYKVSDEEGDKPLYFTNVWEDDNFLKIEMTPMTIIESPKNNEISVGISKTFAGNILEVLLEISPTSNSTTDVLGVDVCVQPMRGLKHLQTRYNEESISAAQEFDNGLQFVFKFTTLYVGAMISISFTFGLGSFHVGHQDIATMVNVVYNKYTEDVLETASIFRNFVTEIDLKPFNGSVRMSQQNVDTFDSVGSVLPLENSFVICNNQVERRFCGIYSPSDNTYTRLPRIATQILGYDNSTDSLTFGRTSKELVFCPQLNNTLVFVKMNLEYDISASKITDDEVVDFSINDAILQASAWRTTNETGDAILVY